MIILPHMEEELRRMAQAYGWGCNEGYALVFIVVPYYEVGYLLQVRYEMLRRHRAEGASVVNVVSTFGVSRPTFYQAQTAFERSGLTGLVPKQRGPKGGHKLTGAIIEHIRSLKASTPSLTTTDCVKAVQDTFGITVHRRSLERALAGKKKLRKSP